MKKVFRFEYLGVEFAATAEVFFESGLLKYRVAYDSQMIVIREILHTIGSTEYILFVQDVEPDEGALPAAFIQEIGWGLEDIDFFPGSFIVSYVMKSDEEFTAQFLKRGNVYKMVGSVPANIEGLELPIVLMKKKFLGITLWQQRTAVPRQLVVKKMTDAIKQYEKGIAY